MYLMAYVYREVSPEPKQYMNSRDDRKNSKSWYIYKNTSNGPKLVNFGFTMLFYVQKMHLEQKTV